MLMTLGMLVAGLILLVMAADWLVRGASRLAARLGIPPLIIGLTVVAFGTSAPELAVSVEAALGGSADIALGNVVGSNIANVLLILGASALITPLLVHSQLIRLDVPIMILLSLLVFALAADGLLGRVDGVLLVLALGAYITFLALQSRRGKAAVSEEFSTEFGPQAQASAPAWTNLLLIVVGLAGLILGARMLVDAAVTLAQAFGVPELVIGLTVVAVGTSLPELATSIMAAIKGERDIAVGNVVGSNIFNLMAVLGVAAGIAPAGINVSAQAIAFDLPVMIGVAVACLPIFAYRSSIRRWEGALFLLFYLIYVLYQALSSQQHPLLHPLQDALLWFVLPLTAITLLASGVGALRERRSAGGGV